jgi:TPP-dependent pyruvate/acetoin dehydrogenase alpha subunit
MRAKGFGFPGVTIDGNDLPAVYATTAEAVARARRGEGPTLIEAKTVRWSRHSAVSAGGYGSTKESERWRAVDPIVRFRDALVEQNILTEMEASRIEEQARHEVDAAVLFAINSPTPAPESLYEDIFA